jgi:hypothetical protein
MSKFQRAFRTMIVLGIAAVPLLLLAFDAVAQRRP